ncbi:MAG: KpsF/GutQ family sugar-phosphate isomerase [Bacteroidaceae bacterium]|nr:KpsF/GutQ family sugar-phosphate isomerase [Bacteroidaceae bacterium]
MVNNIDVNSIAERCLRDEAQAVMGLIPLLDDNFDRAIDIIYNSKGRFIITGVGKSGHIGAKIAATLASTGTPSFFVNPLDAFHGDLGMFTPGDVVMAISKSGNTDELLRFIPLLRDRHIPIIAMTGNPDSLLARNSSCNLNVYVEREACPLNLAPTSSTTAMLAMGDAIACALMEVRRFKAEDFALFHPGGSLGKRLLMKVKDVMSCEPLPIVTPDTMLSDAIITMTAGKKGMVVATDSGRVVGIITDGDLRRTIQKHQRNLFDQKVGDVMTRHPKTISEDAGLAQAADIMLRNSIHSLVVLNSDNVFVGIVDYFACL